MRLSQRVKVLVYPSDSNPYQTLLYGNMKSLFDEDVRISQFRWYPSVGVLPFFPFALIRRLQGYKVLHIHWPNYSVALFGLLGPRHFYWLGRMFLGWAHLLQFRIIWTVHNVTPHEPLTTNDLDLAQRLSRAADVKILHSSITADQMAPLGIDIARTVTIPHGHYIGVYGSSMSRQQARAELDIGQSELIFLFFGAVRSYKGVTELITAMQAADSRAHLIIAGSCDDPILRSRIISSQHGGQVTFIDGYVPDAYVSRYYSAANAVCLPFRSVTTSGSTVLAMSFARAVIAPRIGTLKDLPEETGYYYDADSEDGLTVALQQASHASIAELDSKGEAGLNHARRTSWPSIASRTFATYRTSYFGPAGKP